MKERVYRTPIRNVAELKQRLIDTWSGLQQRLTNSEVGSEPVFELTADTLCTCCSVQYGQHSVVVTY